MTRDPECVHCGGRQIELVDGGNGNVLEVPCFYCMPNPVPCLHIWAYYDYLWTNCHTLGWNLLRRGYLQWANGCPESLNNLY